MKRWLFLACSLILFGLCVTQAHVPGASLTWNREISRIFFARCVSCHNEKGSAFSLTTFQDVQPRLDSIKESVLARRMPPWGAVKGFGDFRNEQALGLEEIELITDWIDGGARRGNNPNALPKKPKTSKPSAFKTPKKAVFVTGDHTLARTFVLDGLLPERIPETAARMRVVAVLPDGYTEPLLWLYGYREAFRHPFLLRTPMTLPAGTVIQGVPPDGRLILIPR